MKFYRATFVGVPTQVLPYNYISVCFVLAKSEFQARRMLMANEDVLRVTRLDEIVRPVLLTPAQGFFFSSATAPDRTAGVPRSQGHARRGSKGRQTRRQRGAAASRQAA